MDKEGLSSPSCSFKVLSWNINGIRTFKNLKEMLDDLHADVVCFQETKITRDMIDESIAVVDGYNAYFSFSRTRSGYSGVATYCRERATPISAEEGLSGALNSPAHQDTVGCFDNVKEEFTPQELKRLDSEGRTVITQHQIKKTDGSDALLTILNVYCPRADPEKPERLQFKLRFLKLLELRARAISLSGSLVMIVGDVNVSHRTVDRCEIVDPTEFEGDPARQWLNSFLVDLQRFKEDVSKGKVFNDFKMIDSFRYFYPDKENAFTCWNTMINARSTNYGSRIDYIFVDRELIKSMIDSLVLSEVQGSDHCPISGTFDVEPQKATKCPSICTKNFPEFFGVQQKLSAFFLKNSKTASNNPNNSPKSTCDMHHQLSKRKISKIGSNNYGCEETSKKPKVQSNFSQKQISSFFQKNSCLANNSFVSADQKTLSSFSEVCSLEDEYSHDLNSETQRLVRCESAASAWRSILTGPQPAPLCKGHKEPCVERTVKKKGPNFNKKFFACARGEGSKTISKLAVIILNGLRRSRKMCIVDVQKCF